MYEARLTKVLFCTSTFALGINMPARSVAFHGLMKFDGQEVKPLSTRGFMQKAGRAGRRGLDEAGHVVLRMDPHEYGELGPVIQRYFKGTYEPVQSSFSLSFNSIINLLERHPIDTIRTIVDRSFLSWTLVQQAKGALQRAEELETERKGHAPTKADLKEARRLRRQAETAEDRCWQGFLARRQFLHQIGYLAQQEGAPDTFLAGAKVLRHIQIAEILITELVLSGELESLDGPTLYGVLCACSGELPRGANATFSPSRKDRELVQKLQRVVFSKPVVEAERITNLPTTWSPEMMVLGRSWAEGEPLEDLMAMVAAPTDISGTLISAFRRAKDLAGQLKAAYADVPDRADVLHKVIRAVSRDEVEVVD
jgi:superfamily II RNA helicase